MNYEDHGRHRRRHDVSNRAMKATSFGPVDSDGERPPPWLEYRELLQWERDHGIANFEGCNGYTRGFDVPSRATRDGFLNTLRRVEETKRLERRLKHGRDSRCC